MLTLLLAVMEAIPSVMVDELDEDGSGMSFNEDD